MTVAIKINAVAITRIVLSESFPPKIIMSAQTAKFKSELPCHKRYTRVVGWFGPDTDIVAYLPHGSPPAHGRASAIIIFWLIYSVYRIE